MGDFTGIEVEVSRKILIFVFVELYFYGKSRQSGNNFYGELMAL